MYKWKLPGLYVGEYAQIPHKRGHAAIHGNSTVYSKQYGLITVGGFHSSNESTELYRLSFDINQVILDSENEWKWELLANMKQERYAPSVVLIDDADRAKLVILGGSYDSSMWDYSCAKTIEIYDLETDKWIDPKTNILHGDRRMAIFHDKNYTENIYFGGCHGHKYIQCYDLIKNSCSELGETNYKHAGRNQHILWVENGNCVLIGSHNGFELKDLRAKDDWNVLEEDHWMKLDKTSNLFMF